jgi:hypothetical protein
MRQNGEKLNLRQGTEVCHNAGEQATATNTDLAVSLEPPPARNLLRE